MLCAKFQVKQTMFEQVFVRKCQIRLKHFKNHNLACNLKHMTIFFDSTHLKIIIYTKKWCAPSFMPNKPSLKYVMRKSAKNAKKPLKWNYARNFKHITIVFNSNHFNRIIYTTSCCVPNFMPNKPSLNYFKRESAKNALKTLKMQLCT